MMRIVDLARAARARLAAPKAKSKAGWGNRVFQLPKLNRAEPLSYYCSVAAIVKNEVEYLDEWISFYLLMGVDHFYIYDNSSSDGTDALLKKYERQGLATIISWPTFMGKYTQRAAYSHALSAFGSSSRWMMFIDADEFAFPAKVDTLPEALTEFEDLPCLLLPWHMFGRCGHKARPEGMVIENFKMRSEIPNPTISPDFAAALTKTKCIVDPTRVLSAGTHRFPADAPAYTVRREPFFWTKWRPSDHDRIVLNHYYSRSEEEFAIKLHKGAARLPGDAGAPFKSATRETKRRAIVWAIDSAPVEDLRIQRFVPQLKSMMEGMAASGTPKHGI